MRRWHFWAPKCHCAIPPNLSFRASQKTAGNVSERLVSPQLHGLDGVCSFSKCWSIYSIYLGYQVPKGRIMRKGKSEVQRLRSYRYKRFYSHQFKKLNSELIWRKCNLKLYNSENETNVHVYNPLSSLVILSWQSFMTLFSVFTGQLSTFLGQRLSVSCSVRSVSSESCREATWEQFCIWIWDI